MVLCEGELVVNRKGDEWRLVLAAGNIGWNAAFGGVEGREMVGAGEVEGCWERTGYWGTGDVAVWSPEWPE